MARILILSSWVACGHVGLSAAQPVLQALGHRVTALPTVMLSNHPGFAHVAGEPVAPDSLRAMIAALEANGWLAGQDALLTGYLPTPDHVALAAELAGRLRAQPAPPRIVVDPVLGDWPGGLYLPEAVGSALRDVLVPLADTLAPNAFELGWLTGRRVTDEGAARAAARALPVPEVVLTSPPFAGGRTGLLHVTAEGCHACRRTARSGVPHGAGDVLSTLIAAGLAPGHALAHLDRLVEDSLDAPHLRIAETAPRWTNAVTRGS